MEVSMMVMLDAREILFVEPIIAFSLELTFIPRMIAVRKGVRDVEAAIMAMAKCVVLLRILAMKEKETVTDQEMEVSMMVMLDAREILFVEPIIAFSLELTFIPRMIAVRKGDK